MNCPRCGKIGLRAGDEWFCLVHGTYITPARAYDLPSTEVTEPTDRRNYVRKRTTVTPFLQWKEADTRLWERWQEGDPVCEGACRVGSPVRYHLSGCRPASRVHQGEKTAGELQLALGLD